MNGELVKRGGFGSLRVTHWLEGATLLLVSYVGMSGPLYWLYCSGMFPYQAWDFLYGPIHNGPYGSSLREYIYRFVEHRT